MLVKLPFKAAGVEDPRETWGPLQFHFTAFPLPHEHQDIRRPGVMPLIQNQVLKLTQNFFKKKQAQFRYKFQLDLGHWIRRLLVLFVMFNLILDVKIRNWYFSFNERQGAELKKPKFQARWLTSASLARSLALRGQFAIPSPNFGVPRYRPWMEGSTLLLCYGSYYYWFVMEDGRLCRYGVWVLRKVIQAARNPSI